jgi:uncharacterized protein YbjT (DUF2867 family)
MYVVLGATGNTGSRVAEVLLRNGEKVRTLSRSRLRLAELERRGAEPFEGDIADAGALTKAFAGARAVYFMIPPNLGSTNYRAYQDQVTNAGAAALESARVRYAVTLSSVGAEQESSTGPIAGLHYMESRFSRISGLNAVHLRAGYFMENTLAQVNVIQNFGMMAGPVRGNLALPMIAARDIGETAAAALLKLDFSGQQTRELLGQRDISYDEAARIVGVAIGRSNLAYQQLPPDQVVQAMSQMGISKHMAELICEMSDSLNAGRIQALEARTAANTTPTSYETFVQEVFLPAYRGKAATA